MHFGKSFKLNLNQFTRRKKILSKSSYWQNKCLVKFKINQTIHFIRQKIFQKVRFSRFLFYFNTLFLKEVIHNFLVIVNPRTSRLELFSSYAGRDDVLIFFWYSLIFNHFWKNDMDQFFQHLQKKTLQWSLEIHKNWSWTSLTDI